MDEVVRDWFSQHPVTVLNVFTVSMILSDILADHDMLDQDKIEQDKLGYATSIYPNIVSILLTDSKISGSEGIKLKNDYIRMNESGMINDFSRIMIDVTNNPNLINKNRSKIIDVVEVKIDAFLVKLSPIK